MELNVAEASCFGYKSEGKQEQMRRRHIQLNSKLITQNFPLAGQKPAHFGVIVDYFGVIWAQFGVVWDTFGVISAQFGNTFSPKKRIIDAKNRNCSKFPKKYGSMVIH